MLRTTLVGVSTLWLPRLALPSCVTCIQVVKKCSDGWQCNVTVRTQAQL